MTSIWNLNYYQSITIWKFHKIVLLLEARLFIYNIKMYEIVYIISNESHHAECCF